MILFPQFGFVFDVSGVGSMRNGWMYRLVLFCGAAVGEEDLAVLEAREELIGGVSSLWTSVMKDILVKIDEIID